MIVIINSKYHLRNSNNKYSDNSSNSNKPVML